jgi:hypothetical protein
MDSPFVCSKDHVTSAGWNARTRYRCAECFKLNRKKTSLNYRRTHRRSIKHYDDNRRRTWGAKKESAKRRRYYIRHREQEIRYATEYRKSRKAEGARYDRHGMINAPESVVMRMLAKLRKEMP